MRWLGYAWTVAVNCFYLFIVVWVFDKLTGHRDLLITVSILGLIYVAVRTMGTGGQLYTVEMATATNKQLLYIRKLLNDPDYAETQRKWDEAEKKVPQQYVKLYINGFFLWLIGIFCLLVLFSTLSGMPAPY